jgi:hypothetical protein
LLENEEAVTIKVGGEKKTGEAARLKRGVRADYVRGDHKPETGNQQDNFFVRQYEEVEE